jgi:hypothetical protein
VAHDLYLQIIGSWAVSNPEIPGFAPPPHDELAFLDTIQVGTWGARLEAWT